MKTNSLILACTFLAVTLAGCSSKVSNEEKEEAAKSGSDSVETVTDSLTLPAPFTTESVENRPEEAGWPEGKMPTAPAGFTVSKYADKLKSPRWTYVAPNGDVFVAESATEKSADRITLLRDVNKDGKPEIREIFMENLKQPLGMLVLKNFFYVANTNGVYKYPYKGGETKITGKGEKIVDLPAGGYNNHWTRNLLANADGSKIYISVGSASNVADHGIDEEKRRANILEVNPDGTGERVYASGLRNPVGMDWAPGSNTLWTAVNERDKLGDELVPDYITSVKEGGFYGWPYAYFGKNEDPRRKGERPDLVAKTLVPDVPVGSHTASLGLAFYDKTQFPAKYQSGAFIGQHGSWNRSKLSGYKVVFVPFKNGKPAGKPEDFLTGFVESEKKVYGRPVGVTVMEDGSMLVNDDSGGTIWRVSAK
ncbi:PQQ-dependent sugar dehydrogenase [Dyadobacter psychrophilus]|uniref:Glucose/arabinose dehydrogenase, beta-propeller fold n=1 Tax=Dyadobacter psychrophilus TaxID=651661 RepID=A0A1T5FZP8_9BACT|nr:sorbosone dehydrogenase family protein [Dyadobacter psychrophilus]SKC01590.1 Glucose/arabinose dehydrogenase, beta-propeller fold [Dyadobacter psychrophilus]